ncbi:MAG: TIGR02680 family protein [Acidimicrobiales bacterium]
MTGRWKPARAGIINIWEYDRQIYEFADGRLILRGPNGSGKSNALALLVPFLLDGRTAATAMDPFAGSRSMRSLLLVPNPEDAAGRTTRHDSRRGYCWLELSRPSRSERAPLEGDGGGAGDGVDTSDVEGACVAEERLVLGVGAQASAQRDGATTWFFLAHCSLGDGAALLGSGGVLSSRQLVDALGDRVTVVDSAEAYRELLDRELFGFGRDRYRRLVSLLLTLRRPKLADKLHLDTLTDALLAGLPPLDDQLLDEVAATFEDLERTQADLDRARTALADVDAFLPAYSTALRAEARARGTAARAARGRLRAARAALTAAERRHGQAAHEVAATDAAAREAGAARQTSMAACDALLRSEAYAHVQALEDRRRLAATLRAEAIAAARRATIAEGETDRRGAVADDAEQEQGRAGRRASSALTTASRAADDAGVPWPGSDGGADALERSLGVAVSARRADADAVADAVAEWERRAATASRRAEEAEAATGRHRAADRASAEAATALEAARDDLAAAAAAWAVDAGIDPAALTEADLAVTGTVRELAGTALAPAREAIVTRRAGLHRDGAEADAERAGVQAERSRLAEAPVVPPDPSPTRTADRTGRPGAPLWACCAPGPQLAESEAAGLEAALEGAGLLDAWVQPGGSLAGRDDLDAFVVAAAPPFAEAVGTLLGLLVVDLPDGAGLTSADVEGVLGALPAAEIRADGRWRLGPLQGRWTKPRPEHLGATAREGRRRRLLAELDRRLAALDERRAQVNADLAAVADGLHQLDALLARVPDDGPAAVARRACERAEDRAADAADDHRKALERSSTARRQADDAGATAARVAAERRVEATALAVAAVRAACKALEGAGRDAVRRLQDLSGARRDHERAEAERVAAAAAAVAARAEATEADHEARAEEGSVAELDRAQSASAEAVLSRLDTLKAEVAEREREVARLGDARVAAATEATRAEDAVAEAGDRLARAETEAGGAARQALVLAKPAVFAALDLDPALTHPDRAEDLVTAAAALPLPDQDDGTAILALERAFPTLLNRFDSRFQLSLDRLDEVPTVWAVTERGAVTLFELREALASSVARQEHLLEEGDRRIFEQYLAGEVADGIRRRLHDADRFRAEVDQALAGAPTEAGLRVHLGFALADDDADLERAVKLLRTDADLVDPAGRDHLRRFFLGRVRRRRAEDPGQSYVAILAAVLDYRSWHRFTIATSRPGQRRQPLTRTEFARMSGGEQASVLHLPLFAAAAATYGSATIVGGPRLIALDEAFAGIDEEMRARLSRLLVDFDLDVVLTGHELWGTWRDVPAVAVYDLLRRPPAEGVSTVRLVWHGDGLAQAAAGPEQDRR